MDELKRILTREIEKIERRVERQDDISKAEVEDLHKLTDTLKNLYKICALEENEGDGYSGARHYVRGHYSREGRGYRGRDGRGRYSSGDGREEMLDYLSMAMESSSEADKEHIRRLMDKLDRV